MKRIILIIVCLVIGAGSGILWMKSHGGGDAKPAEAPAASEEAGPTVEHDTNGNVVITINDEIQGNIGLKVGSPTAVQIAPEVKGYGRVLDPAPLAALMTELATAQAAYVQSSNELARLNTLAAEGNSSPRAVQAADAAAAHDQLAVQSAKDRVALTLGRAVAERGDLAALVQSLTAMEQLLVRIDLPAGETIPGNPQGARIVALSGQSGDADFLGAASHVDPSLQGQGFLFLMKPGASPLPAETSVTGYLKSPGEPVSGVVIPRDAVVRTEGAGWVYVMAGSSEAYTRMPIPLDHPTDAGWFVAGGLSATNYVVVTGAQTLLSHEMKAALKPD